MQDELSADPSDSVWKALASPLRRAMLDVLRDGPLTTGDLASHFEGYSRFAIMQHLGVLAEAELVLVQRDGRRRYNYFNPVPIQLIYDRWVGRHIQPWTDALVDLRNELETNKPVNRRRGS